MVKVVFSQDGLPCSRTALQAPAKTFHLDHLLGLNTDFRSRRIVPLPLPPIDCQDQAILINSFSTTVSCFPTVNVVVLIFASASVLPAPDVIFQESKYLPFSAAAAVIVTCSPGA